jgi:hypothetical protein
MSMALEEGRKVGSHAKFPQVWELIANEECKKADALASSAEASFAAGDYHNAYFNAMDAQDGCSKHKSNARLEQIKAESLAKGQRSLLIMPLAVADMNLDMITRLPHAIADTIKSYQDPFYNIIDQTVLENKLFENDMTIEQVQAADLNKLAAIASALNMRYIIVMKLVSASVPTPQLNKSRGTAYLIEKERAESEGGSYQTYYFAKRPVEYSVVTGKRISLLKVQVKLIDSQRKQILFSDMQETSYTEKIDYVDTGGYSIDDMSNIQYNNDEMPNVRIRPFSGINDWQSKMKEHGHSNLTPDDVIQKKMVGRIAGKVVHDVIVAKMK